jgi:hypothetical protein
MLIIHMRSNELYLNEKYIYCIILKCIVIKINHCPCRFLIAFYNSINVFFLWKNLHSWIQNFSSSNAISYFFPPACKEKFAVYFVNYLPSLPWDCLLNSLERLFILNEQSKSKRPFRIVFPFNFANLPISSYYFSSPPSCCIIN